MEPGMTRRDSYELQELRAGRQRTIRLILVGIILFTLPFYCAGLFLWGTATPRNRPTATPDAEATSSRATNTAIVIASATPVGNPTITPFPITVNVPDVPGFPTQATFVIQTLPPLEQPTRFLSPTPTFLVVPTNPPAPTNPPPPTQPAITNTPLPFDP
jgi:hypothetical protein